MTREKEREKKTHCGKETILFVKKKNRFKPGDLRSGRREETINPRFVEIESRLIEARVRADCTGPDNVAGPYIILNYIGALRVCESVRV